MADYVHPVQRRPTPSLKPSYQPKTDWAGNLIAEPGDNSFFHGSVESAYQASWRACTWAGIGAPTLERDPEIISDMVKYLRLRAWVDEKAATILERIARQGFPATSTGSLTEEPAACSGQVGGSIPPPCSQDGTAQ